nr:MAG TPA: Mycobacterial 2 TMS Phage Holin (M2 Hol) Family [Bacteriophage sp.]
MNMNTGELTKGTAINNEAPNGNDNYVPTFNAATRKWAYLISGLVGIAGAVLSFVSAMPDVPAWVAVMGGACALVGSGVAGMFGVHYAGVSK